MDLGFPIGMDVVKALVADERGFIVTIELLLIVTIVVIGLIAGLAVLRDAVVSELNDVANAINSMNQDDDFEAEQPGFLATAEWNGGNDFSASQREEPDNCVQVYGRLGDF